MPWSLERQDGSPSPSLATSGEMIRDLMVGFVESRFGR
jgi:hypothetical protein